MSHQRFPSHDPVKEPHGISLKVLRLSRPSLVTQHPLPTPSDARTVQKTPSAIPASLAYSTNAGTNPDPFLLSPILNLPPSFGSAYVGETFSCTLCANSDAADAGVPVLAPSDPLSPTAIAPVSPPPPPLPAGVKRKSTRDVRIEAEMKTPGSGGSVIKLPLSPPPPPSEHLASPSDNGVDLEPGQTLQKIVNFDLKEEGNHVLAVTVSYYEATETSGRVRTFRKLYQFIAKGSLIVRTKVSELRPPEEADGEEKKTKDEPRIRKWVMEAQLENCSEEGMQLEKVQLEIEDGLKARDCNWEASGSAKPVLQPGAVEQVCFVVEETAEASAHEEHDGRVLFGALWIAWRSEMGNRGSLSTGKLGTRATVAVR